MDNSTSDNDNPWLPSKEEVALVNYAIEKVHSKKTKLGKKLNVDILSIEQGSCDDLQSYIRVLACCMRKLVPSKMKISKLALSERAEVEKLMNGKVSTIGAYKEMILLLGRMPDLPPKQPLPWWWGDPHAIPYYPPISAPVSSMTRSTYKRRGFNSDFEYGITDT